MPVNDLAALLFNKADQDLYVLDKLATEDDAPIDVFGFHAQQAVEKLIKATLAAHEINYPRSHRLGELVDIAADHGVRFPKMTEDLVDLTPYAVEFRYDAGPDEGDDDLDKIETLRQIRALREWVAKEISQGPDQVRPRAWG